MKFTCLLRNGERPPPFFGDADAVFASDGTTPGENLAEQLVQGDFASLPCARLGEVHHDVRVDVAIAGVAEAGELQLVLFLEARGKVKQVLQTAARDDDVLVQFGKASVSEGIGELAADFPDCFALLVTKAGFDKQWFVLADNALESADFASHRGALAVKLYNEVSAASA